MRIYVDFDDVLCETARRLSGLARELFRRDVPYEQIRVFDLQKAFSLSGAEIHKLMAFAHDDAFLASLDPVPGAVDAVRALAAAGHAVTIVTGRPACSHAGSEQWLARHGLTGLGFLHVDKYGRAGGWAPAPGQPPVLSVGEFSRVPFDAAVDDSPDALDLLAPRASCRVIVFDRPWNRAYALAPNMERASGWPDALSLLYKG
jgi:uncharacterized HAD superfamily protein